MACPDESDLSAFVGGTLEPTKLEALSAHLDTCTTCFATVAELMRADASTVAPGEPATPASRLGQQLDEYHLVRRIGRGSGGEVWLAEDTLLARHVAIKFVSRVGARAADRFRIEARAIARLSHPNVVTVHRVGETDDGQPYLVSELVRGHSLDSLPLPLPWQQAREIGRGLARGLAAAHRAGVVHRDIKPSNAILGEDGTVKLLDFGLAKLHEMPHDAGTPELDDAALASPKLTATGHLLGTPLYMAPEAWQGAAPSSAMDVYSLGAVLYELCCGHPPHGGHTMTDVRRAALAGPPRDLRELVPDIDPAFARVIMRCVEPRAEARYASSVELCAALEPAQRPTRRWAVPAIAAIVLAIALAAVAFVLAGHRAPGRVTAANAHERCSVDRWCWDAAAVGTLFDVWGARRDDVWIVGERGVLRHYDGHAWADVALPTVADLMAVHGSSATDVWVVGMSGTIFHWDGHAWVEVGAATHARLLSVWASSARDAWIVGDDGLALHWDGAAWTAVPTPTKHVLLRVAGASANDVWAFGYDACIHWDGHGWTAVDLQHHELVTTVYVAGAKDVWAAGFHSVIRHWDGARWSSVPVPEVASPRVDVRDDYPFNAGDGIGDDMWMIAKRRGFLHRHGTTWTREDQGTRRELYSMKVFAPDDAWAVGIANAVVHWDGHAWTAVTPEPADRTIVGMWGQGADDVWAVGNGVSAQHQVQGLVMHYDGRAWTEAPLPAGTSALHGVSGVAGDRWAVGDAGVIVHDADGRWTRETSATSADLHGVWADARGHAWAVGTGGAIVRRDASGWHAIASPTTATMYGVWGAAPGDAWAVGDHVMLHLAGDSWTRVASPVDERLLAVWGTASDDVWAVGDRGATVHWNGNAWTAVYSDFDEPLVAVAGSSKNDVWAVSPTDHSSASIIHWDGAVWTLVERTPHADLSAVWAVGPDEAWAAGWWATFFHHVPRP